MLKIKLNIFEPIVNIENIEYFSTKTIFLKLILKEETDEPYSMVI